MPGPSLTPSRPATLTFTLTLQVQVQFRSVRTLEFVNASKTLASARTCESLKFLLE